MVAQALACVLYLSSNPVENTVQQNERQRLPRLCRGRGPSAFTSWSAAARWRSIPNPSGRPVPSLPCPQDSSTLVLRIRRVLCAACGDWGWPGHLSNQHLRMRMGTAHPCRRRATARVTTAAVTLTREGKRRGTRNLLTSNRHNNMRWERPSPPSHPRRGIQRLSQRDQVGPTSARSWAAASCSQGAEIRPVVSKSRCPLL